MIKRKKISKKSTGQSTDTDHRIVSDFIFLLAVYAYINHNTDKNIFKQDSTASGLVASLKRIQNSQNP